MRRWLKAVAKRLPPLARLVAERDALRERAEKAEALLSRVEPQRDDAADQLVRLAEELDKERQALTRARRAMQHQKQRADKLVRELKAERLAKRELKRRAAGVVPEVAPAGDAALRRDLEDARSRAEQLQARVDRQRDALEELRQRVVQRAWRPGYARHPLYVAAREEFLEQCKALGGLTPQGSVLDVGCGIGGLAGHLATYLTEEGSYVGLDVDDKAIEVGRRDIAPYHPGFRFEVIDVYNSKYRPHGSVKPDEYSFPFDDGSFDLVTLRSVFSHMLPPEVSRYLAEIRRVLRPGGRALITWFLLNEQSLAQLAELPEEKFPFDRGSYRLSDEEVPEARVAYDEAWVMAGYRAAGLEVVGDVVYGGWPTADMEQTGQDLIVAEKPGV